MWGAIKKAINSNLNKSLDVLIQEKHSETNSKIDSKSSQVSVDTVKSLVQDGNNLIGSTNNTGGGVGIGSVSAKLNKLLTDWTTTRAGYIDTTVSSRATQAQINALEIKINNLQSTVNNRGEYPPAYDLSCELIQLKRSYYDGNYQYYLIPTNKHIYYIHIVSPYSYSQFISDVGACNKGAGEYGYNYTNIPINNLAAFGGKGIISSIPAMTREGDIHSGFKAVTIDVNRILTNSMCVTVRGAYTSEEFFQVYCFCKK